MIKTSLSKGIRKNTLTNKVKSMIDKMEQDFHDEVKSRTPRKTGRAQDGWRRTATGSENTVPYIAVLDRGRKLGTRKGAKKAFMQGSDQAPQGMTRPAMQTIKQRFAKGTYLK